MPSAIGLMFYVLNSFGLFSTQAPILNINSGRVEGSIESSRGGKQFFQFLGIPYAKPPVGELRFEPPSPAEPWIGILRATQFGAECMQFDAIIKAKVLGDENCLFLNVYSSKISSDKGKFLPVMVYIHGGGFTSGSANIFGPKYFMDEDIVLVTLNYRLAALGFLNTGDELVRGNMGLKDQNLALRWVQENIKQFGGNSSQVTIFGESAGAACVHYHILSPLSKGLFHRAIMQSGNVVCPWAFTRNPMHQAKRFAKSLGCPSDNTTELVNCLKGLEARKLVKPHVAIMSPLHTQDDLFVGSVEAVETEDTFLSVNPFDLLAAGNFSKVPIIMGVTSAEGGLKTARIEAFPEIFKNLGKNWRKYTPVLLHYNPAKTNVTDQIRSRYFGTNSNSSLNQDAALVSPDPADDLGNFTLMISEGIFFHPTHSAAQFHAKHAPVHLYYYDYRSQLPSVYSALKAVKVSDWISGDLKVASAFAGDYLRQYISKSLDPKNIGACHGDDILLLWNVHWLTEIGPEGKDYSFSKAFVRSFTGFSKNRFKLHFNHIEWPQINANSSFLYMHLNNSSPNVIKEPFEESISFWDSMNIRNPHETENW